MVTLSPSVPVHCAVPVWAAEGITSGGEGRETSYNLESGPTEF